MANNRDNLVNGHLSIAEPAISIPWIDVIIPSADRPAILIGLLGSLETTGYLQNDHFHFQVVDNSRDVRHSEEYQRLCAKYGVAYLRQEKVGLSRTLNFALLHTDQELIVLLDDDVAVPAAGSLEALIEVLYENPKIFYVSGRMIPFSSETEAEILFEMKKGLDKKHEALRVFTLHSFNGDFGMRFPPIFFVALGGFCALRRQLVQQIGDFDPRFGCGSFVGAGNMGDFCIRAIYSRYAIAHNPDAVVYHRHRRTLRGLADVRFRYAQADTAIMIKHTFCQMDWRGIGTAFLYHPWKRLYQNLRLAGYPLWLAGLEFTGNLLGIMKGFIVFIPWGRKN